jgi:hypothetical protein
MSLKIARMAANSLAAHRAVSGEMGRLSCPAAQLQTGSRHVGRFQGRLGGRVVEQSVGKSDS